MRILYAGDIMKKAYKVRIVLAMWIIVLSLAAFEAAYLITKYYCDEDNLEENTISQEELNEEAIETTNTPLFLLAEEDGMVVILYYQSREEYDKTNIYVWDLSLGLQEEIKNGIPIKNFTQLYDFLENYSS